MAHQRIKAAYIGVKYGIWSPDSGLTISDSLVKHDQCYVCKAQFIHRKSIFSDFLQIYPLYKAPLHVDRDPCGTSYRPLCIYLHPEK